MENPAHQCPVCHNFHTGDYACCQECIDNGLAKQLADDYDYGADDFAYDSAREDRYR